MAPIVDPRGAPIVQVKLLGGFGNQLHQYASAKKYAQTFGARLETPPWCGQKIFVGIDDPPWSCDLPEVNDGSCGHGPTVERGQVNIRLSGYFQTQFWIYFLERRLLRDWFRVRPEWIALCGRDPWDPYIAAHVRQGDYLGHPLYANVSEASYLRALEVRGLPVDRLRWVHQDRPRIVPGVPPEISFLPDFLTLMNAAVLLRANSTFSWWAAVLSDARVLSPLVEDRTGLCDVEFAEGNWPRCADTSRVGIRIDDLHLSE